MNITVLGGGHGCYAAAVEMAEKGHQVRLWRRDSAALKELLAIGSLTIRDYRGTRQLSVGKPGDKLSFTDDLAEALGDAQLVIIPLPSTSHEDLARHVAPHLRDGQVVFLPPGTFGSYVFAKAMADAGNLAKVAFAETGTLPYLVRKHGASELVISCYATRLPTGVFPSNLSEHAFTVLREAYPSVEPIEDALSGALMNAGPIIHPPLIMMNAGPLEHFPAWDIHNEGTQPSVRAVTTQLDNERMRIREALGYGAPHFRLSDHYENDQWMYGDRSSHAKLVKSGDWREKIDLHEHRYMREDTMLGLAFFASVADWAGVDAPVTKGLLAIAGAIVGEDLRQGQRTLASLGLDTMSREQLQEMLQAGRA